MRLWEKQIISIGYDIALGLLERSIASPGHAVPITSIFHIKTTDQGRFQLAFEKDCLKSNFFETGFLAKLKKHRIYLAGMGLCSNDPEDRRGKNEIKNIKNTI